jgi:hypothetical protein
MSNPIGVFGAPIQADGGPGTAGQDEAEGPSDPMSFMCTAPGTTTVTVLVDDGPLPNGETCSSGFSTMTATLICDPYPTGQAESAWVEIAAGNAGNVAIARAITAATAPDGGTNPCPNIVLNAAQDGGTTQQMNVRAPATLSLPLRSTIVTPNKPSFFPVTSCEFQLPPGTTSATVGTHTLPMPKPNPQTIVVIGDTGCRLEQGNPFALQACNDPTQWPFATIAQLAAAQAPDLVLHVGDYQYRESECPAGSNTVTGCGGSPWGYGWDTWEADLFTPGAPLLAAAPWVVVRGNHEMCNRAGQGWYRFLDTNPFDSTDVHTCDNATYDPAANGGNFNNPYLVAINSVTQLVVFDSANAPGSASAATSTLSSTYESELTLAGELVANPPSGVTWNWWTNHHPIIAFQTSPISTSVPYMAPLFNAIFPNTYFPTEINLVFHGHVHDYQAISFASEVTDAGVAYTNPATIVSGNAGDLLATALPSVVTTPPVSGVSVGSEGDAGPGSAIASSPGFGYMVMQYQSSTNTWLSTEYRTDNSVRDTCTVYPNGTLTCASWGNLP